jgi:hypothetical protein
MVLAGDAPRVRFKESNNKDKDEDEDNSGSDFSND